jgi:molybdopterin synthase sulfur carrier subunit
VSVTVRLFAAARDALGAEQVSAPAGELSVVLAGLGAGLVGGQRERWERVAAVCSLLVDGRRARPDERAGDGSVVDVLPPFAGG